MNYATLACPAIQRQFIHFLELGASYPELDLGSLGSYDVQLNRGLQEADLRILDALIYVQNCCESRPFIVAEIGCGQGVALRELKTAFGHRVKTVGFDLVKTSAHKTIDDFVAGDFETLALPQLLIGTVDFVFSQYVFRYFTDAWKAVLKAQTLLSPLGVACIDLEHCKTPSGTQVFSTGMYTVSQKE